MRRFCRSASGPAGIPGSLFLAVISSLVVVPSVWPQETSPVPPPAKAQMPPPATLALPVATPYTVVSEVVIPSPPEVFAVLDKLGRPDWAGEIRLPELAKTPDRQKLSLAFGAVVAEGFLAVQARKADAIQEVGRKALKLAGALGLEAAVKPHANGIMEEAEKANWKAVRAELDRTEQTVKDQLQQLQDPDLGELVSLGGWLRGTHAITSLLSADFNQEHAEILNQPDLVAHFQKRVTDMSADQGQASSASLLPVQEGLTHLLDLMRGASSDEGFSATAVTQVHTACEKVLQEFYLPNALPSPPLSPP